MLDRVAWQLVCFDNLYVGSGGFKFRDEPISAAAVLFHNSLSIASLHISSPWMTMLLQPLTLLLFFLH